MPTIAQQVEAASAALRNAAPRIVLLQAQTVLALVTLRVQNQGLKGQSYSSNFIPTFLFEGKELNAGGRAYLDKNPLGNWGGFRAAQGLTSSYVNLTYSGRMFRSLLAVGAGMQGAAAAARIVASTQEDADKVKGNTKRYGDFLAPDAAERAEVNEVARVEITRIVNTYFNQI